jgi:hypothetical protein
MNESRVRFQGVPQFAEPPSDSTFPKHFLSASGVHHDNLRTIIDRRIDYHERHEKS